MSEPKPLLPETWLDEYGDGLFRYALFRLRDDTLAEDAVQETFAAALKSLRTYTGQSTVRNWLMGILKHKIGDQLRQKVQEERRIDPEYDWEKDPTVDGMFDSHEHWSPQPCSWFHPRRYLYEEEFLQAFQRCLDRLPPCMAEAFTLRVVDGFSMEETQEVLRVSNSHVGVLLYRARLSLRRCLEKSFFRKE